MEWRRTDGEQCPAVEGDLAITSLLQHASLRSVSNSPADSPDVVVQQQSQRGGGVGGTTALLAGGTAMPGTQQGVRAVRGGSPGTTTHIRTCTSTGTGVGAPVQLSAASAAADLPYADTPRTTSGESLDIDAWILDAFRDSPHGSAYSSMTNPADSVHVEYGQFASGRTTAPGGDGCTPHPADDRSGPPAPAGGVLHGPITYGPYDPPPLAWSFEASTPDPAGAVYRRQPCSAGLLFGGRPQPQSQQISLDEPSPRARESAGVGDDRDLRTLTVEEAADRASALRPHHAAHYLGSPGIAAGGGGGGGPAEGSPWSAGTRTRTRTPCPPPALHSRQTVPAPPVGAQRSQPAPGGGSDVGASSQFFFSLYPGYMSSHGLPADAGRCWPSETAASAPPPPAVPSDEVDRRGLATAGPALRYPSDTGTVGPGMGGWAPDDALPAAPRWGTAARRRLSAPHSLPSHDRQQQPTARQHQNFPSSANVMGCHSLDGHTDHSSFQSEPGLVGHHRGVTGDVTRDGVTRDAFVTDSAAGVSVSAASGPPSCFSDEAGTSELSGYAAPSCSAGSGSLRLSEGGGTDELSGPVRLGGKRPAPGGEEADKRLRQKIRKREAQRRRYHQQQSKLVNLERLVEESCRRNLEMQQRLAALLEEQNTLTRRETELVATQQKTLEELEELKNQQQQQKDP